MIQDCAHQVGLHPSLEVWNDFFDQVGTAFELDPANLCHATYDGLVEACMPMKRKVQRHFKNF